jgi:glycosyltransferase involved in cell wall biosynthesis
MRIAYIANYQGADLVKNRPCLHNFSLAARVKIQLIAELLCRNAHDVEIISQGSLEPLVGRERFRPRFYPELRDGERFHPDIPVHYVSALSLKYFIGLWESIQTQRLLTERHKRSPFDAVIIYNMQSAQVGAARHARRLGLPVILQYEDDSFVDVHGRTAAGVISRYHLRARRQLLKQISGGTGVSPYLLSQMPEGAAKLLLRGVVSGEIMKLASSATGGKKNWVVFSGTHEGTQGLEPLVTAWQLLRPRDWELHIAGRGPITATLETLASGNASIIFHGLLNREENARLLCAAKIGMNPQDVTATPGNVFAFKIVEYLAAGAHVITTPRGSLEADLEAGVSYIPTNTPEIIAESLAEVIRDRRYDRTAADAAIRTYGPDAVAESLNNLLERVTEHGKRQLNRRAHIAPGTTT